MEDPPDNYILFRNGPFSKSDHAPMTLGSTRFSTSEHAYQWRDCMVHMREDLAEEVFQCKTPKEAKTIEILYDYLCSHSSCINVHSTGLGYDSL